MNCSKADVSEKKGTLAGQKQLKFSVMTIQNKRCHVHVSLVPEKRASLYEALSPCR